MSINKVVENMKPVPFRQQPKVLARVKNAVLEVPEGFIDMEALYELSTTELDGISYIIFKKMGGK